jgi:hypothetical protein
VAGQRRAYEVGAVIPYYTSFLRRIESLGENVNDLDILDDEGTADAASDLGNPVL